MSSTVDVNVLVHAANDADPFYGPANQLLRQLVSEPRMLHLFWPVLLGFVRIATHPRILPIPWALEDALENVESLIQVPHVRVHGEAPGFWEFARVAQLEASGGPDVPDAHIVALMRQHGVRTIHTQDRGFRRFDGIEVRRLTDE